MGVDSELPRYRLEQALLDRVRCFPRRQARPVGDSEDMRIDRNSCFAESGVEHNVRGLASYPWERFERFAGSGNFAAVLPNQGIAGPRDVAGLGIE